jgi:hypothetical protein
VTTTSGLTLPRLRDTTEVEVFELPRGGFWIRAEELLDDVGVAVGVGSQQAFASSANSRIGFVRTRMKIPITGLYAQTLENSVKVDFRLPQSGAALVC